MVRQVISPCRVADRRQPLAEVEPPMHFFDRDEVNREGGEQPRGSAEMKQPVDKH